MARNPSMTDDRRRHVRLLTLAAILMPLAGCDLGTTCTADWRPAVTVNVFDAGAGGAPLGGATGYIARHTKRPSASDTMPFLPMGDGHLAAGGHGGIYDVRVNREGYASWTYDGAVVTEYDDGCHKPNTVSFDAYLTPD